MKFKNQYEAAEKLIELLPVDKLKQNEFILICLSFKSVKFTEIIANKLNINYDIFFTQSIKAPNNHECEIAAVSETKEVVINKYLTNAFDISNDFIYGEADRKYEEKILKNIYKYRKGKLLENLDNINVLLVDEGCQTGARSLVAIKSLMNLNVKSLIYATPLVPFDMIEYINTIVDEFYCVLKIKNFVDTDFYYEEPIKNDLEEISNILENSSHYLPFLKSTKEKNNAIQS